MRHVRTRAADSTFDINLAPVLDIIVCLVSLLLLSAAYLEVKGIETDVPQVVKEIIEKQDPKTLADISLILSKKMGLLFRVNDKGRVSDMKVPPVNGAIDLTGLHQAAKKIKSANPQVFNLSMAPEKDVSLEEIVQVMDQLRKFENQETIQVKNPESGEVVSTNLMFPNIVFSNVLGDN